LAHIENSDNEIKPTPSAKPKLTMKFLHVLILEIQQENDELLQRINELEQQIGEIYQSRDEVATTSDQENRMNENQENEDLMIDIQSRGIQLSRSERHVAPRKKPFWF